MSRLYAAIAAKGGGGEIAAVTTPLLTKQQKQRCYQTTIDTMKKIEELQKRQILTKIRLIKIIV